ncbi:acyl-CoA-binding domain-containing protein 6-like isoform X1 [Dendroctonus ponderosae]|uniref:acyl-CoA-binding domain-containing protein 6 isoform X1 n=1 Tax=Dendroctonus ponderosae TaxID=77166 RepID=UPI002034C21E|nr:acyl-CoA-binding domain-containing protein 6 isoform X1 [Dendroctonus ponderosae]XP_019767002.2 acyl-CoA-binding domain-containing protein 6 isoform X1 [Dendroctonus ponderosae]XP_048525789.1 acyl-CoA-binding domain-containing protein 6-like isoform X1 [Dendroctonus ponderosae]
MASSPEDDFSDLKEIGIDVVEANETLLARKFGKCLKHVQTVVASLDNRTLLRLYGFYKQSVEGPCSIPKPGWYDLKGQSKWQAWKMLGDLDKAQAMEGYIQLTLATCPDFSLDGTSSKAPSWVAVSAPIPEANSSAATISDHIRSGDLDQVAAYLKHNPSNINRLDSNGLGLIHYAADIGDSRILELLLKGGCQVNLQVRLEFLRKFLFTGEYFRTPKGKRRCTTHPAVEISAVCNCCWTTRSTVLLGIAKGVWLWTWLKTTALGTY